MTSTKFASYLGTIPKIPRCERLILDALTMQLPKSREELAAVTGLRLSTVCGRVTPMLKAERLVQGPRVWNAETKRNVETLTLP